MDPKLLTSDEWSQLGALIVVFWGLLAAVTILGGSLLMSLAFLPSLVATRHLPSRALKLRPLFLLTAAASLLVIALLIRYFVLHVKVLEELYPRWWI